MQQLPLFFVFLPCVRIYFPPQKFLLAQKLPSIFQTRHVQAPASSAASTAHPGSPSCRNRKSAPLRKRVNIRECLRTPPLRPIIASRAILACHQQRTGTKQRALVLWSCPPFAIALAHRLHSALRAHQPVRDR